MTEYEITLRIRIRATSAKAALGLASELTSPGFMQMSDPNERAELDWNSKRVLKMEER